MVWDPTVCLKARLAETAPAARRLSAAETDLLRSVLTEHFDRTGSPIANVLLGGDELTDFWVVEPSGDVDLPSEAILETAEVGD